uniref:Uncharacterized protein n=1 Tax=Rangifer tarandus platyrhynchus TaxID=3082113 RepID=A0ACB0EPD1_RANTA|nr:unnamed protein product [Rangifer tarandus platyrhynchus]
MLKGEDQKEGGCRPPPPAAHHEVEEADFWAKLRPLIQRCGRARACLQPRVRWCGEAMPGAPLATTRRQDPAPALVAGTGGKPLGLSSSCC